jgi:soluble lytic murein transglycosylase-like protein/tetratricopeptide (TPR) repeat protein
MLLSEMRQFPFLPAEHRFSSRVNVRWRAAIVVAVVTAIALNATPCWSGLDDLARSGDWKRVLEIAARRADQLPLNPTEAMIAARAARAVADPIAERRFLEIAAVSADGELQRLAEVQLAKLVGAEEPGRAVSLALPAFGRENPWQVRAAATEVSQSAINVGIEPAQRATLEGSQRKLSRSLRRKLELTLALSDSQKGRHRLERLLAASTRDLVALEAAEALAAFEKPTSKEQWRVAQTLYRHAMYDRVAPMLEQLVEVRDASIPRDEAAFFRGRCAFRRDRWQESIEWYQKALSWERSVEKKAEIEVHIGRCYELEGDLDKAVDAAVRAVQLKTTDDRRLFLARLRLRRGEPDLAKQGLSRLRSRTNRARGEVMLAVDAIKRGDIVAAQRRLENVQRSPWAIPAAVLSAELAAKNGDADVALEILNRIKGQFDDFWVIQARLVMGGLPQTLIEDWRLRKEQDVKDADQGSLWRALGRWAVLEPDPGELRLLRGMVDAAFASFGSATDPAFPTGLAAELWTIGLEREAARWDHAGWPRRNAVESAWTASQMLEHGFPWRSTRVADGAWRQAGSDVPTGVLPENLRRALYPLPEPVLVREAAAKGGVHWSLLAGVAREESRWEPQALSAVGARGLVQLMPSTAVAVAANSGLPRPSADDLFDPSLNLRLGATELGRLVEAFSGRWAPAVAAYNAGEVQARLWLDQCGSGCTSALYLQNISFGSTRAYTAEVLAAAISYGELYANNGEPLYEPALVSD